MAVAITRHRKCVMLLLLALLATVLVHAEELPGVVKAASNDLDAPATATELPATTAPVVSSSASSAQGSNSAAATPATTPMPTCNDATEARMIKLFANNAVLEADCAAVNDGYKFPFDKVPGKAMMLNMSKSSSCLVLMEALLQVVPTECNYKRISIRTTASSIVQLGKNLRTKTTGDDQHVLLSADLLVVGTWSDNPNNFDRSASSRSSVNHTANAKVELLDKATNAPMTSSTAAGSNATAAAPVTSKTSGSRQLAVASVQVALMLLTWVFVQ